MRNADMSFCKWVLAALAAVAVLSGCGGGYNAVEDVAMTESALARKTSTANPGKGGASKNTTSTMTVTWIAPTLNDDGSPLTDLKGYVVLLGTQSGVYDRSIPVSDPKAMQYSVEGLLAGQYYVAVKAVNLDGVESIASTETSRLVQ
jgi:hypothetical protein